MVSNFLFQSTQQSCALGKRIVVIRQIFILKAQKTIVVVVLRRNSPANKINRNVFARRSSTNSRDALRESLVLFNGRVDGLGESVSSVKEEEKEMKLCCTTKLLRLK